MYSEQMVSVFFLILIIWLGVLSYLIYKDRVYLRGLFPKEGRDIRNKFLEVVAALEETQKQNITLNKNLRGLSKEVLGHIQKVEVIRYNPYGDTGGNQSFSVALLDGNAKGLVVTSLHTRAGTRVYVKEIVGGRSELTLSKEEQEVVSKALNE